MIMIGLSKKGWVAKLGLSCIYGKHFAFDQGGDRLTKKKGGIAETVTALAAPIAEACGVSLWDVRYEKEGATRFLRIILEKPDGYIDINDCERVSRALSDKLDEVDPIPDSYCLEVSSPGLDRELRRPEHFAAYLGEPVTLRLIRPLDGRREFEGVLTGYNAGQVTITCSDGELVAEQGEYAFVKAKDEIDMGGSKG